MSKEYKYSFVTYKVRPMPGGTWQVMKTTRSCNILIYNIMERKRILCPVNISTDMFMTSFDKAAEILLEQKCKLEKEGWTSLHLKMDYFNGRSELLVMGMRLENDTEYNKRVADEQKKLIAAQKKVERVRKNYEEIKLKYGW